MEKYILYKIYWVCSLYLLFFSSCSENLEDKDMGNVFTDNVEIRIDTRNLSQNTGTTYSVSTEAITRLDVLVYNHNGGLFEYLNPQPSDKVGVFIARMQKDVISGSTNKDVFVVANWNETEVEALKSMLSPDVKKYIINSSQTFDNGTNTFSSADMMSACKLGYDFASGRVMEVNLNRMYSKLSLKFVYDYLGTDTIDTGNLTVSPKKVRVTFEKLVNLPTQLPLFPDSTVNINPIFQDYTFPSLVLAQGGAEITDMNSKDDGAKVYDSYAEAPFLKLYPHHTAANDTTEIHLKLEFYEDESQPSVIELERVIKIGNVKHNRNYQITMFINQMDKKTRAIHSLDRKFDDDFCRYEIIDIPYTKE